MRIFRHISVGVLIPLLFSGMIEAQQDKQSQPGVNYWQQLESGLEFGEFPAPLRSESGDSLIRVLRIDPEYFALRLFNTSSTTHHKALTAKEWCQRYNLIAAINASMYQTDYLTSVSLMRTKDHVNNSRLTKDKAILAFDRQYSSEALVKIIDRQCENFDDWQKKYTSFVQSIRMISCKGRNVWRQQLQKWSTAVIATDRRDKVLFIHVRSRYTTHDLINMLLELPLEISRAMYAEGGSEAQLYIKSKHDEYHLVGSHGSSGFNPYNGGRPIPNIIGIERRKSPVKNNHE